MNLRFLTRTVGDKPKNLTRSSQSRVEPIFLS